MTKAYFYEDTSFEIGIQYGYLFKAVDKKEFYSEHCQGFDVLINNY